jgi:amino-acid N-acetyltransferase
MAGPLQAHMLEPGALPAFAATLADAGLPTDDLETAFHSDHARFWRFEQNGELIGYAGLEWVGDAGLLRSMVIPETGRGRGQGRLLLGSLLPLIEQSPGLRRLFLLTTTAAGFFERQGFERVRRDSVPSGIAALSQFAGICPASAVCMHKDLGS